MKKLAIITTLLFILPSSPSYANEGKIIYSDDGDMYRETYKERRKTYQTPNTNNNGSYGYKRVFIPEYYQSNGIKVKESYQVIPSHYSFCGILDYSDGTRKPYFCVR